MTGQFWRPDGDPPRDELYLVAAVSSAQRLYVILEGPPLPPPRFKDDPDHPVPMLTLRIATASGVELRGGGHANHGKQGSRPRTFIWDVSLPPDRSEPLIMHLLREDGSTIWETQAIPADTI
jgi:hypothetical protein